MPSLPMNPQELFRLFALSWSKIHGDSDHEATADCATVEDSTTEVDSPLRTGHWAWNPEDDSYYFDPSLCSLLGYSQQELPRTQAELLETLAPSDCQRIKKAQARLLAGHSTGLDLEYQVQTRDGRRLQLVTRGQILRSADGSAGLVTGLSMDITNRTKANDKLRAERNQLYALLDRLPVFLALIAPDHSLRFTNQAFREIFGPVGSSSSCHCVMYKRDSPCEVCPPFDVFETKALTVWETSVDERHYQIFDYPFVDTDGAQLVLEIGFDLTRVLKTQQALRASEERYKSITDNMAMGIAVLDRDFHITAANPKMRQWFGLNEGTDRLCHEITRFCEQDGHCAQCPCRKTLEDGGIHEALFENTAPEGRSYRVISCPIFDDTHRIVSLIEMVDDVTEKLEVQTRLQRAEKVQALGTLAGGLAHEINQPLNALHLYASGLEMLLEKDTLPDRATLGTRIGWIVEETEKIRQTITHMRVLASGGEATVVPTDVNAAVMRSLKLVSSQLEAHGTGLDLDLTPGLPLIAANPVQMEQIILNLVINALHALDEQEQRDKRIEITSRLVSGAPIAPRAGQVQPALSFGALGELGAGTVADAAGTCDVQFVHLVVADNGPGLGREAERIFDPFYTTKDAGRGMGLGLSLVHTFVSSWGGGVAARNRTEEGQDGGAEFTVRLRLLEDD